MLERLKALSPLKPIASPALAAVALALLSSTASGTIRAGAPGLKVGTAGAGGSTQALTTYQLTNDRVAHWAVVLSPTVARGRPSASGPTVTTLQTMTSDGTQNVVLVLDGVEFWTHETWYRVRLPILPNNSTGWVRSSALGQLYSVDTHLYIDRATFTATLVRNGVTVFKTIVGVGRPSWPTPAGQFYIRDELTDFNDPFYGPVAFGTSARSAVLTDWPGGGFIGVHGTDEPQILPGRVSHGCIRMPNAAILKLARLMPVGTPVTIT
jgi:lipoprotein-anchoring transpeptidase ErfK/SrfK